MTPQELCSLFTTEVQQRLAVVLTKASPQTSDRFIQAATEDFLADNVADIFTQLRDDNITEFTTIGQLESNAFLASFQRAYEMRHRPRMRKWADAYTQANKQVDPDLGALIKQMRLIGIKVDPEFTERFLKTGGV